jgi:hypothetical protein
MVRDNDKSPDAHEDSGENRWSFRLNQNIKPTT